MEKNIKLTFDGPEFKEVDVPNSSFLLLGPKSNFLNPGHYQRIYRNQSSKYIFYTEFYDGSIE